MFRPVLPNDPVAGGVMNDFPLVDTKQPACSSVPLADLSAAPVKHSAASAAELATGVGLPDTPLVIVQTAPGTTAPALKSLPGQKGIEFAPDLKSAGLPKKSQRSAVSPLWLKLAALGLLSDIFHGWGV